MNLKLIFTSLILLTTQTTFAVEESKNSEISKNLILSLHTEIVTKLKNQNFTQMYLPTIGYKILPNLSMTLSTEFGYQKGEGNFASAFPDGFYRALFTTTLSEILNEKSNYINLSAGIARRYFYHPNEINSYGNTRLMLTPSKSFGKLNVSTPVIYYFKHPNDLNISETDFKNIVEVTPTLSVDITENLNFNLNDKISYYTSYHESALNRQYFAHEAYSTLSYKFSDLISPYFQFHYKRDGEFTSLKYTDNLNSIIGASLNVYKNTTLSLEAESSLFVTGDNRTISKDWARPDLTLYLDWNF